jgi:hypothetical protein
MINSSSAIFQPNQIFRENKTGIKQQNGATSLLAVEKQGEIFFTQTCISLQWQARLEKTFV